MNIDDIFLHLDLYGYAVIEESSIKKSTLNKLSNLHKKLLFNNSKNTDNNYSGGYIKRWNCNLDSKSKIEKSYLMNFIESDFVNKVLNTDRYKKFKLNSVFATLDNRNTNHIAQDPHFDRVPSLKFMLYLNDMKHENGAFMLSPGSQNWVKKNFKLPRPAFASKKFLEKTRKVPKIILDKLVPIEGKAGTIIIFDTDTIHNQGIVEKGESRIIRFHFSPPGRTNKYYSLRERIGTYVKPIKLKLKSLLN